MIKAVRFINPVDLMGKSVKVFLWRRANDAAAFYLKVESVATHSEFGSGRIDSFSLMGFDDEGQDLRIESEDIDFIIGG